MNDDINQKLDRIADLLVANTKSNKAFLDEVKENKKTPTADEEFIGKQLKFYEGKPGKNGYTPVKGKDYFDGEKGNDGIGITKTSLTENGELVIVFSDGKSTNLGIVKGKDGVSPSEDAIVARVTALIKPFDEAKMISQILAKLDKAEKKEKEDDIVKRISINDLDDVSEFLNGLDERFANIVERYRHTIMYGGVLGSGGASGGAVTSVNGQGGDVVLTTTNINEGTNEYFTAGRFNTQFATKSTSDLTEGTNLYFTLERAMDAVGNVLTDSAEIDFNYNDAGDQISASIVAGSIDETKLDASVNASLDLADSALQASDIANTKIATITFVIDGGGSVITTGVKMDLEIPFACTINSATVLLDQSGSIVLDIWKDTYGNYPPVVGDSITASAKPTVSGATKSQDSTLTGWTTSITAGQTLRVNVDSIATATRATLSLKVTKT